MKGYEIFKVIANKEIKDGTQFRMLEDDNIYTYRNNNFVCKYGGMNVIAILNKEFEIIEEQEEIDIQSIEEIKDIFIENSSCGEDVKYLARKYNEILKWAKQVDKKIKEK